MPIVRAECPYSYPSKNACTCHEWRSSPCNDSSSESHANPELRGCCLLLHSEARHLKTARWAKPKTLVLWKTSKVKRRVSARRLWQIPLDCPYQLYLVINITVSHRTRHPATMFCHIILQSKTLVFDWEKIFDRERRAQKASSGGDLLFFPSAVRYIFLNVSEKPSGREAGDFLHAATLVQQCICGTLCSPKVSGLGWGGCEYPGTQTGNSHNRKKHLL